MRVLGLLLIAAFFQEKPVETPPVLRRMLTLRNWDLKPLPAESKVGLRVKRRGDKPVDASQVKVLHGGRQLETWFSGDRVWFRAVADIAPDDSDAKYEIRYPRPSASGQSVAQLELDDELAVSSTEFEDCLLDKLPDPSKWTCDPGLTLKPEGSGLAVTGIPGQRTERNPASLTARFSPIRGAFDADISIHWEITEKTDFSFAVHLLLDEEIRTPDAVRLRTADIIRGFANEDVWVREKAGAEVAKLGRAAIPQLREAARSSDAEVRSRVESAIAAIEKDHPTPTIRTWLTVPEGTKTPIALDFLPRDRAFDGVRWDVRRTDRGDLSVIRDAQDLTRIALESPTLRHGWSRGPAPGTCIGIRFDFWGPREGYIGAVWLTNVRVNRTVPYRVRGLSGPEELLPR